MKRVAKYLFGLLVVVSVLFFVGCDNLLGSDDDGDSGGGGGGGTSGVASVRVVNNSGYTIYYLYISPSSSGTWGPDQHGSSVISSGYSFTVNNIPAGTYDLRAVNSLGDSVYEMGYYMGGGTSHTWTINTFYGSISEPQGSILEPSPNPVP